MSQRLKQTQVGLGFISSLLDRIPRWVQTILISFAISIAVVVGAFNIAVSGLGIQDEVREIVSASKVAIVTKLRDGDELVSAKLEGIASLLIELKEDNQNIKNRLDQVENRVSCLEQRMDADGHKVDCSPGF